MLTSKEISIKRGLATVAVAIAFGVLTLIIVSGYSAAQTVAPNADFNRFTPAIRTLDREIAPEATTSTGKADARS